MKQNSLTRTFASVFSLVCTLGCGAQADDGSLLADAELDTTSEAIKNGIVLPNGAPLAGTVFVSIWSYDYNKWATCSGQVSSRNTIVTAAHCFADSEFSGNSAWWPVFVWKQIGPNSFKELSPDRNNVWVDVQLNPGYWTNSAHTSWDSRYDFAVVRSPSNWLNTVEGDSASFLKGKITSGTAWGLGYGRYGDNDEHDDQLRGAQFAVTATNDEFYRYNVANSTKPQICLGDSGGPLKISSGGITFQIGVSSFITGGRDANDCGWTSAFWARTDKNWSWLKNTIGGCTDGLSFIRCW